MNNLVVRFIRYNCLYSLDLKGQVMLGDTGSNLLGFILGYYMALIPFNWFKFIYLIF